MNLFHSYNVSKVNDFYYSVLSCCFCHDGFLFKCVFSSDNKLATVFLFTNWLYQDNHWSEKAAHSMLAWHLEKVLLDHFLSQSIVTSHDIVKIHFKTAKNPISKVSGEVYFSCLSCLCIRGGQKKQTDRLYESIEMWGNDVKATRSSLPTPLLPHIALPLLRWKTLRGRTEHHDAKSFFLIRATQGRSYLISFVLRETFDLHMTNRESHRGEMHC